jgi:hypothetical protein
MNSLRNLFMDQRPTLPTDQLDGAGYETRDVRPRGVVALGAGLTAIVLAATLLLWWLFGLLERRAGRLDAPVSPLARHAEPARGPHLEVNLKHEEIKRAAMDRLAGYGWVDKRKNIAHIPVERAMQILAQRGLPEPSGPVTPPSSNTQQR